MRLRNVLILLATGLAAMALGACGSDDDGDSQTTSAADGTAQGSGTAAGTETAAAPSAGAGTLTIEMNDFSFTPQDATAQAGNVTISAPNAGQVEHELVLFKTDADPASLPTKGDEIDEEALEAKGIETPGEIEEVAPGQTKQATLKLTPGQYVMFCNLPAHYQQGMYGTLTVN